MTEQDMSQEAKTWIKVHTGLTNDPKHREEMGVRVWYFMWLVDKADWETGVVFGYTDAWAAREMVVSQRTIEDQRQHLEKSGYITCTQRFQCQDVRIMRWRNPRFVNAPQINIPGQPDTWYEKLRTHDTETSVPIPPGSSVPLHKSQSVTKQNPPPPPQAKKKPVSKKLSAESKWDSLVVRWSFPDLTFEDAAGSRSVTGQVHRILLAVGREKGTIEELTQVYLEYDAERAESNGELPPLSSAETIARRLMNVRGKNAGGGQPQASKVGAFGNIKERIKRSQTSE